MAQHDSQPSREDGSHALPDVETFYMETAECRQYPASYGFTAGWYYHFCFPGCLPDSEPNGPFATEADALADARDGMDDDGE